MSLILLTLNSFGIMGAYPQPPMQAEVNVSVHIENKSPTMPMLDHFQPQLIQNILLLERPQQLPVATTPNPTLSS